MNRIKEYFRALTPAHIIMYIVILAIALGIDVFGALCLRDFSYQDKNETPVYYEATTHNTILAKVTEVVLDDTSDMYEIYYFKAVLLANPNMNEETYGYFNETYHKGDTVLCMELLDLGSSKKMPVPKVGARIYLTPYRMGSYAVPDISLVPEEYQVECSDGTIEMKVEFGFSSSQYSFYRAGVLLAIVVAFCALVILMGGMQGFNTILSLALICGCLFYVFVPQMLRGQNIYSWSIFVCVYSIVTTIGLVVGPKLKALCAALGNFVGVMFAGLLTYILIQTLYITGNYDINTNNLAILIANNIGTQYDLSGIVFAATTIGSMGAVMDVAMSLASSLQEVYDNSETHSVKKLFKSGMTIGRDMMGTMANTLVLAYIGSSLAFLLYMMGFYYDNTIIRYEQIAIAIIQAVVGSLGILVTIPFTSLICSLIYTSYGKKHPKPRDLEES